MVIGPELPNLPVLGSIVHFVQTTSFYNAVLFEAHLPLYGRDIAQRTTAMMK